MPTDNTKDPVKIIEETLDTLIGRWKKFQRQYGTTEEFIATFLQNLTGLWETAVILYALLSIKEQPYVNPKNIIGIITAKFNKIDEQVIDHQTKANCEKQLNEIEILLKERELIAMEELINPKYMPYNNYKEKVLRHVTTLRNLTSVGNIEQLELELNLPQAVKTVAQTLINYKNTNWSAYKSQLDRILPIEEEETIATKKITASTVHKIINILATSNEDFQPGIINIIKGNLLINKPLASVERVLEFTEQLKVIIKKSQASENFKLELSNAQENLSPKNRAASSLSLFSKPSTSSSNAISPFTSKKAMPSSPIPVSNSVTHSNSLQGKQLPRSVLDEFRNKAIKEKDSNEKTRERHDLPEPS